MSWGTSWDDDTETDVMELPPETEAQKSIVKKLKKRYTKCVDWEAEARNRFDYDIKFANGDTHNKFQWDSTLVQNRELQDRPVLTINKTQQHNLLVINDAKQNKPGVRIRPVSDEATFDGAEVYQELVYHTEYISNAETVYDSATTFQVEGGIGYWRIVTDWVGDDSFDQEIYIRHIKDPRSVYLDPDINEIDGSDARFGIIFEDMSNDIFKEEYPKYASLAGSASTLGNDGWLNKDDIRVAEYYYKEEKQDKLVTWTDGNGQVLSKVSALTDQQKLMYKEIKKQKQIQSTYQFRERNVVTDSITWCKIAGDRIIDSKPWLGKYIPIVRLIGTETVIDGQLDRKGHTRALINAQQMYNYNSSANIEYGALQTKAPWLAPSAAITNFEEYYKTANTENHSYIPYNHMDEDGNPIPPPTRPQPPQPGTGYIEGLKIAANEMMMASGQWQSQLGENENAKSGVAINARQRQGDRATYHFLDNQAIAIRFTGKILIDLYPKIYDTKRVKQILARDGTKMNVQIDPNAPDATKQLPTINADKDHSQQIEQIIFNPNVGTYDVRADTGPSFATRRMEAFAALTQLATAPNSNLMQIGGDLFFKVADFPEADILADRYRRTIPPNILDDTPDPHIEQAMHQASDKIEQLTAMVGDLTKKLADKDKEIEIKAGDLELRTKEATVRESRGDYDAETKRLVALGNSGPAVSLEQIQPALKQLIRGMLNAGELGAGDIHLPGPHEGGTPIEPPEGGEDDLTAPEGANGQEQPPIPGARKALDGHHYVSIGGQYHRVEPAEA